MALVFGRFYDLPALMARVIEPARRDFAVTLHELVNAADIDAECYLRRALVGERVAGFSGEHVGISLVG